MKSKIENQKSKIPNGFTLIELLVVMAIIGILMGLLFPALSAARHRARVTRARTEMKQVETAWISYRNDHRELPSGITEMGANAVNILRGDNPRGIAYMEFPEWANEFKDPWGEVYRVALADNRNPNQVRAGPRRERLNRPVAVWSVGYDPTDPVTSW